MRTTKVKTEETERERLAREAWEEFGLLGLIAAADDYRASLVRKVDSDGDAR